MMRSGAQLYATALALAIVAPGAGSGLAQTRPATIFNAIDALEKSMPFSKKGVEIALAITLKPADQQEADPTDFIAKKVRFEGDGSIVAVDLRLRSKIKFMVLEVAGQCITRDAVEGRFGKLDVWGTPNIGPRHPNPEPGGEIIWSTTRPWGKIVMEFRKRPQACLHVVAFHTDAK
jgi:hypothetical protein